MSNMSQEINAGSLISWQISPGPGTKHWPQVRGGEDCSPGVFTCGKDSLLCGCGREVDDPCKGA